MAWNSFDPSMMGGGGWKNHGPAFVITRRVVSVCMAFGVVSELCLWGIRALLSRILLFIAKGGTWEQNITSAFGFQTMAGISLGGFPWILVSILLAMCSMYGVSYSISSVCRQNTCGINRRCMVLLPTIQTKPFSRASLVFGLLLPSLADIRRVPEGRQRHHCHEENA